MQSIIYVFSYDLVLSKYFNIIVFKKINSYKYYKGARKFLKKYN